jgi:hypothetical protein
MTCLSQSGCPNCPNCVSHPAVLPSPRWESWARRFCGHPRDHQKHGHGRDRPRRIDEPRAHHWPGADGQKEMLLPIEGKRAKAETKKAAKPAAPKRPPSLRYREPGSEHDRSGSQCTKHERGRDHPLTLRPAPQRQLGPPCAVVRRRCRLWSCMLVPKLSCTTLKRELPI